MPCGSPRVLDHVVLFTGDGDFRALVAALQMKGKRVSVVSTLQTQPPMVADELRRQADQFIDLADLEDQICRDPAHAPAAREPRAGAPAPRDAREGRAREQRAAATASASARLPRRSTKYCSELLAADVAMRRADPLIVARKAHVIESTRPAAPAEAPARLRGLCPRLVPARRIARRAGLAQRAGALVRAADARGC